MDSSVRPMTATTGRTVLVIIATLSLVLSFFAFNVQPTFADGAESPAECLDTTEGITGSVGTGNDDERAFTASSNEIVTGVCIKAGAGHSDLITADGIYENGCYEVEGIGTQTVTVTRLIAGPDCPGISHLDVRTEAANPDLEINKSADAESVNAGDQITYTITVDNNGNATATNVEITDDLDDSLTVDSATFAVDDGADTDCSVGADNTITCAVGDLAAGSQAVATVVVTTSAESCDEVRNVSSVSADNDAGDTSDEVVVGVVCEELGGITITKIVDCEDCATFTRGRYFNSGQGEGAYDTDQLFDADSGGAISIPGTGYSFANAGEVEAYIDSNVDDGLTEQAVVQYLTVVLNIRYNDEFNEGCDLGSQIYTGSVEAFTAEPTTVDEILEAAAATLAGGTTYTLEDVTTALDEINNSGGDGEGADDVLACAGGNGGSGLEGVTFELYLDDGDVAGELDDGDTEITHDDAFVTGEGGVLTITGLDAGDYFLVEVDRPAECGELAEPIVFGPFTVVGGATTLVEDPLINECEVPEQPGDVGSITIIKNAAPDAAQDFAFTTTGTGLSSFSLDDDADATLSNQRTFGDLAPGSYTVTESATAGWTLTSITCSAGGSVNLAGRTATITIAGSENVTCTFVNTLDTQEAELGSITIIKNAAPDAAQDFAFTTTGTGLSSFSLDDDADATLSNQRTFGDLAPGSYTVTESATAGWTLTSITCSAGGSVNLAGRTATITIAGSENVTCTFVNTRQGEGTQGGSQPGGGGPTVTPREGTLAGNPLPNTATTPAPGGSLPAILLALIALGALTVGGRRVAAEARSRR